MFLYYPKLCEKLNLNPITSRDVTIIDFDNQVLQGKLDCVRVCLKSTDNENFVINCLVEVDKSVYIAKSGQRYDKTL